MTNDEVIKSIETTGELSWQVKAALEINSFTFAQANRLEELSKAYGLCLHFGVFRNNVFEKIDKVLVKIMIKETP